MICPNMDFFEMILTAVQYNAILILPLFKFDTEQHNTVLKAKPNIQQNGSHKAFCRNSVVLGLILK